ncbi:MAG: hypothetical protein RJB38_1230 [Pseudomonadota bacterium]
MIAGAFAAHALKDHASPEALEWMKTGAFYQLTHALALFCWALWREHPDHLQKKDSSSSFPGYGFSIGMVIFSGTLYAMALGAPRWLGAITPVGGSLLIASWFTIAAQTRARFGKSAPDRLLRASNPTSGEAE